MSHVLQRFGWDADLEREAQALATETSEPARVAAIDRGSVLLFTAQGERRGTTRSHAGDLATGDWVIVEKGSQNDLARVIAVLSRRTKLARKVAGKRNVEQPLVANIDTVFIVAGLGDDFNPRRIERYLTLVWAGGARPVLVLTKVDMCDDVPGALRAASAAGIQVPVHAVSGVTGEGLSELQPYLGKGQTIATVGSSGVGKSTLINALCGEDVQAVRDLGWYGKGQHTTTRRELVLAPGGALFIDTPGLREVGLWAAEEGLGHAFADVERLAAGCRFNDCAHEREPGCAVVGTIPPERLESYRKLQREARAVAIRGDKAARAAERRQRRRFARSRKRDAF